jgi:diacylglycerol O-acyltransferase-1
VNIVAALLLEKLVASDRLSDRSCVALQFTNAALVLVVPTSIVWFLHTSPAPSLALLFLSVILFMKLVSYTLVNLELRRAYRKGTLLQGVTPVLFCCCCLLLLLLLLLEDTRCLTCATAEPIHPQFLPNPQVYPNNLNLRGTDCNLSCTESPSGLIAFADIAYFVLAPTLIYQLNYPRSARIRRGWLAGKIVQLVRFMAHDPHTP